MARLSKALVAQRREFVLNLVRNDNAITALKINEALAKSFNGVKMRPQEVYSLKNSIIKPKAAGRKPNKQNTPMQQPAQVIKITRAGRNPGDEQPAQQNPVGAPLKNLLVPMDSREGQAIINALVHEAGLSFA